MKKIKESIANFFERNNFFTAILILVAIGAVIHFIGYDQFVNDYVDAFWKHKQL